MKKFNKADRFFGISLALFFIAGLLIGWFVIGWWMWPVEYTGAGPEHLIQPYRSIYVGNAADLYSYDLDPDKALDALADWRGDREACLMAAESTDMGRRARLEALAYAVNGVGCP